MPIIHVSIIGKGEISRLKQDLTDLFPGFFFAAAPVKVGGNFFLYAFPRSKFIELVHEFHPDFRGPQPDPGDGQIGIFIFFFRIFLTDSQYRFQQESDRAGPVAAPLTMKIKRIRVCSYLLFFIF